MMKKSILIKNLFLKTLKKTAGDISFKADYLLIISLIILVGFLFSIYNKQALSSNFLYSIPLIISSFLCFFLAERQFIKFFFAFTIIFLVSCYYVIIYDYILIKHNEINSTIYAQLEGKVEDIKRFSGKRNEGYSIILNDIKISRIVRKEASNNTTNKINNIKYEEKVINYSEKKIKSDFLNIDNLLEIDRKFLDESNNFQFVNWQKNNDDFIYPNPPKKIKAIINDRLLKQEINVNDIIKFKALIKNDSQKEFPDDFDFKIYNNLKKIGGVAIATSDFKIIEQNQIDDISSWFLKLREIISKKISNSIDDNNQSAIALALLVGDKSNISENIILDIRKSGLSHLLSISGFHMALAGSIFFILSQFLLSRNESLMLNFDIRKISAIIAIISCFFYLKISGDLVPAKRAFAIIFIGLIASLLYEKINSLRALSIIALFILFSNPYQITSAGFQLSFIAVLIILGLKNFLAIPNQHNNFLYKSVLYLKNILLISGSIQIFTLPFLLYSFGEFSILSPLANLLAIPIASFITMPFGFLSFFLMPFNFEKIALYPMAISIDLILLIATNVSNINFSAITLSKISGLSATISFLAIFFIFFGSNKVKFVGFAIFIFCLLGSFSNNKYDLSLDNNQKFFTTYNEKDGLIFSKKVRESAHLNKWLEYFNEKNFKYNENCHDNCILNLKNKKFLIIVNRSNTNQLCNQNDFDLIVNLTGKYKLPRCFDENVKIDNNDFLLNGGYFIKIKDDKIRIYTSN